MRGRLSADVRVDNGAQDSGPGWGLLLSLALLVLAVAAPVLHPRGGEQQASRYALTAALWDYNTVELDNYVHALGRDRAVRDGVVYSDKAPGQPFLAVPFYGLYRLAGGEAADQSAIEGVEWGLWWVTLWTAAVPGAVLAVLMYLWAREIAPRKAVAATLTLSLGTLLLVYSTLLFGHVLAACFLMGMFLLVRSRTATTLSLLGAGALAGAAVLTEYPVALIVAVLVLLAFVRHGAGALAVLAGGVPAAGFLAWYNWRVAGSPFVLSYQWTGFSGERQAEGAVLHMFAGPQLDRAVDVLFSERGLFVATPIVMMGLLGVVLLWRLGHKVDSAVVVLSFLSLFTLNAASGNSYAGGAGPRYLAPALPFLAAALAMAWSRWARTTNAFAAISLLTMVAATLTNPQLPSDLDAGLGFWLISAANGVFAPNVFVEVLGGFGWLVYLLGIAGATGLVIRFVRTERTYRSGDSHSMSKSPHETYSPETMSTDV